MPIHNNIHILRSLKLDLLIDELAVCITRGDGRFNVHIMQTFDDC